MALLYAPHPFSESSKREAIATLLDNTIPDRDFYVLLTGAALLAIGGIFLDSVPVLIASMIVAPLAYQILGLSLGLVARDIHLIRRTSLVLGVALMLAFSLAVVATAVFGNIRVNNIFISFSSNLFLATCIALLAGGIAAYGLLRPKVSNAITGIAIAVSLMPPLVATGIELASEKLPLAQEACALLLLNIIGILAGSAIVFTVLGVGRQYRESQHRQTSRG